MSKIKIFSLGGLNEDGKNMYVVDVDQEIYVFDAGIKYDNDINLGIDYIIPNFDYLIKNRKRIKGIFLTHGHESNMEAVVDILEAIPEVNIYGTKLTLEIVKIGQGLFMSCDIEGYSKIRDKYIRPNSFVLNEEYFIWRSLIFLIICAPHDFILGN